MRLTDLGYYSDYIYSVYNSKIKAALETFRDHDLGGVTAPITLTPDNHRGSSGLRIFQVQGTAWEPITEFRVTPDSPS